jgi:NADH-quinone oxidoreductase subunit F
MGTPSKAYADLVAWAEKQTESHRLDLPSISIALGSCSLAVGAEEVASAVRDVLKEAGIPARLFYTGCPGLCSEEVLLTITSPGRPRITYRRLSPDLARQLVSDSLVKGKPRRDLALAAEEPYKGIPAWRDIPYWAKQERLVLANCGEIDPEALEEYLAQGGYQGLAKALAMSPEEAISEVIASGLRGRGGAGFPVGRKWEFCRKAPAEIKYLVCNADESEPGTFKDRLIMEGDPQRVLEGIAISAYAIGAHEAYIYVRGEYPLAARRLQVAIEKAHEHGLLGDNILDSGFSLEIRIHRGAGAYICGEETALIESIEGKRGIPRMRPPYPPTYGLFGKPTAVNNVESLASLPDILQRGSAWYRERGTEGSPGTKIYAILGDVERPMAFEAPLGITIQEAAKDYGTRRDGLFIAQTGGSAGTIVPKDKFQVSLDYDSFQKNGVSLGSGTILVGARSRRIADILLPVLEFFHLESCGKCTPCREGTWRAMEALASGLDGEGVKTLEALSEALRLASFCGLGTAAAIPLDSALAHFGEKLARSKRARYPVAQVLPRERVDRDTGLDEVRRIIAGHSGESEELVEALRDLNERLGYLSRSALRELAEAYRLTPSQVYGIATFYSLFSVAPTGEHIIRVCKSAPCHFAEGSEVVEAITEHLGIEIGGITADGLFTLEATSCLGLCGVGPAVTIDGRAYGRLTPDRVHALLFAYRGEPS